MPVSHCVKMADIWKTEAQWAKCSSDIFARKFCLLTTLAFWKRFSDSPCIHMKFLNSKTTFYFRIFLITKTAPMAQEFRHSSCTRETPGSIGDIKFVSWFLLQKPTLPYTYRYGAEVINTWSGSHLHSFPL